MTATVQFNLGKYLREHGLTAYALVKEVDGVVPASTVYGLARKPVQRVDLPVVYALLDALRRLRGVEVEFDEFVEESCKPEAQPDLSYLKLDKGAPKLHKKFKFSGSGTRVNLPTGTVARMVAEGREP